MRKYLHIILLCLAGWSQLVFAGTQTGQVTAINIRASDGLVLVFLAGTASDKPACAKFTYWMIRDENSAVGKKQLALLMMARATGQPVTIVGSGKCDRWSDGEDIDVLLM